LTWKTSAPDSDAVPMSLGVCNSMQPCAEVNSRSAVSTVVCTLKISRRAGLRKSRKRQSRRWSVPVCSLIGNGVSARLVPDRWPAAEQPAHMAPDAPSN
jgi:hypothetical protein